MNSQIGNNFDADSGSDSASLKTSIVKKSNEYVINGTKVFLLLVII